MDNQIRNKEIEIQIVNVFIAKNRKDRALYLMKRDTTIDDLFHCMEDKFINSKYMYPVTKNQANEDTILWNMARKTNCYKPYFFSVSIKSRIDVEEICKMHLLVFQEILIYFGRGIAFFQAHEKYGTRERYYLTSENDDYVLN